MAFYNWFTLLLPRVLFVFLQDLPEGPTFHHFVAATHNVAFACIE